MLNEPELHLNSAVQAKLLPFIKKHCVEERGVQVFVCTHSPEIVKAAFEDNETSLYHLRSGTDLTPILIQDHRELFSVFDRLGNSPADILFNKGNIYVEGVDDHQMLQAGYGEATQGFKINALGGRNEVEKEIRALQSEEKLGRLPKRQLFILDNDRRPASLESSELIRIHQHDRYCFENYLLDEEIVFDLLQTYAKNPPESRGSFSGELETLALSQIPEIVIKSVYTKMKPPSIELLLTDIVGKTVQQVGEHLTKQILDSKTFIDEIDAEAWKSNFAMEVNRQRGEMEATWRSAWRIKASGKRIMDDLYVKYEVRFRKINFKKEVIKRMSSRKSDDWRVLDQVLRSELA